MPAKKSPGRKKPARPKFETDPAARKLTERQAAFLAAEAKLDIDDVAGLSLGDLAEKLRFRIDPHLLLFRKICGRVVKRDPATGELWPVPNATVYVEDTDCSFLGFFPVEGPWGWLFPGRCRREVIAVVQADECGEFCVWVPRWDIDRIRRWRRERICFPDLVRPRIRDLLDDLPIPFPPEPEPGPIRPPRPEPDPVPFLQRAFDQPEILAMLDERLGFQVAEGLLEQAPPAELGASRREIDALLDAPAPAPPVIPGGKELAERAASVVSLEHLGELDFGRAIGPFRICRDVFVPEWVPLIDVPDITFRVTQGRDDGTEVTVYREGFFDVRWNDDDPGPVVLEAGPDAIAVPICDAPEIECEDKPAIDTIGFMSLLPSYHDDATGEGTRVNRPRPAAAGSGSNCVLPQTGETARAPYARRLDLFGCHHIDDATHYRILRTLRPGGPEEPFLGVSWWAPRQTPHPPLHVSPDPQGWYVIQPASMQLRHPHWVFAWPTWADPNGTYDVVLQLGKAGRGGMVETARSDPRGITIDNTRADLTITSLAWRQDGDSGFTPLPLLCPVIDRDPTKAVTVRVEWTAAAAHLRDARVWMSGCGAGSPTTPPGASGDDYCHWYEHAGDNTVTRTSDFVISSAAAAGCYTVHVRAWTRAFNPSNGTAGPFFDWFINHSLLRTHLSRAISVVDSP